MAAFVEIGRRLRTDRVNFSKAVNWGTWSASEYGSQCVWDPEHPNHAEFEQAIADPILNDPIVFMGNLEPERRAAIERLADRRRSRAAAPEMMEQ